MADLVGHLGAVDRASLFDALERAATRVGLALFVVHVDASPPTLIYVSGMLADLVGRDARELVGHPPWELVAPQHQALVRDTIARRGPGAPPLTMELDIERPDGARREIEVGIARISTAGAELSVCYFRDRTDEHAAAAALRRSEERFRSLIENAPDGVVILQDGRIALANTAAVRMLAGPESRESLQGRMLADFVSAAEAARAMDRIGRLLAGESIPSSDYRLLTGLIVEVHSVRCEYDNKPATVTFLRDATERRRMQEQLVRADRLAALGTMAATVAHEINNPLTYLQLNLQRLEQLATAERDPARAALLREHLANAMHGVERVARIVRDLRAHSRDNSDDEPELPVDVVAVVDGALQMVEHDLRHRAQLVRRNPGEPAIISGHAARLEQVVINLLVNAIQALDGNAPAANRITIGITVADELVTITLSDTGPGLPDPERAFEPFFTTKPAGVGTGLGLSVCKQLVERMRGRITIESTSAAGTTVVVELPRRHAAVAPASAPKPKVEVERLRVLVIDDELHVVEAIRDLLTPDHDVEIAIDGESALALVAAGTFDVILCDLMMPRMTGRDVFERIRERWPGLERRVVFVTGGAFIPSLASFLDSIDNLKLRKPFTFDHVLEIMRQAQQRAR